MFAARNSRALSSRALRPDTVQLYASVSVSASVCLCLSVRQTDRQTDTEHVCVCLCLSVCPSVYVCVRARLRACVRACVHACCWRWAGLCRKTASSSSSRLGARPSELPTRASNETQLAVTVACLATQRWEHRCFAAGDPDLDCSAGHERVRVAVSLRRRQAPPDEMSGCARP